MNRILAFGFAAVVAIALLAQSVPGAAAAEKKVKAKGSNKGGIMEISGLKQEVDMIERKKNKGVKAKGKNPAH